MFSSKFILFQIIQNMFLFVPKIFGEDIFNEAENISNNNLLKGPDISSFTIVLLGFSKAYVIAFASVCAGIYYSYKYLNTPCRKAVTDSNKCVSEAYDEWAEDKILQVYWKDHLHLGYYEETQLNLPYSKLDLPKACDQLVYKLVSLMKSKGLDITDGMIVDAGCGLGATSRLLKQIFPNTEVLGINISPIQLKMAKTYNQNIPEEQRPNFIHMDAMDMDFEPNSVSLFWVCESTEHMYDREKFYNDMLRCLKPGGVIIICSWDERDSSTRPFTVDDTNTLNYLYSQWGHYPFTNRMKTERYFRDSGKCEIICTDNWTRYTLPSWYHLIYLGAKNPMPWITKLTKLTKFFKDAWCLHTMQRAFASGLMEYNIYIIKKVDALTCQNYTHSSE